MNAFKAIRQRLGSTQAEIAEAIGVTQSNVSFYEQGQTIPPKVAGALIEFARTKGLAISYDTVYGACEVAALPPQPTEPAAAAGA